MRPRLLTHLAARFARSLAPLAPRRSDVEWAQSVLTSEEWALWQTQPRKDLRESIAVARRASATFEGTVHASETVWLAAALLHDVGKRDARLGTLNRSLATIAGGLGGRKAVATWSAQRGLRRRVATYLDHADIGAAMLSVAGARPETAVWARRHHSPETWDSLGVVPPLVAQVLASADGEDGGL